MHEVKSGKTWGLVGSEGISSNEPARAGKHRAGSPACFISWPSAQSILAYVLLRQIPMSRRNCG